MERELKFEEIFQLYLSKWPALLVSLVAVAFVFLTYSFFFVTPLYTSSGTLYITSENPAAVEKNIKETVNLADLMLAQELAKSYEAILSSNTFLKAVAEESDMGYNYKQLSKMISVSKISETEIMQINVVNPDPAKAQELANIVLKLAPLEIERIIYGGQATIIDPAEYPEYPTSPNIKKNTLIGGFLGLAAAAAVIFLLYLFDTKIKSSEELQAIADAPVLGVVPEIG